ncbi:MAG: hypothetical protein EP317_00390 [Bacillota bacterium]|nr:MAG: hypothetical protein EP317_00390 [Bacillota bacterium]
MLEELLLQWQIVIYLMLIGVFMFIAKILKTKAPFLNKVVIPTSLLGGFLGLLTSLIFSPILFGTETFFDGQIMDTIVYHALAIGFIALALKREPAKLNKKIWSTGMLITSTYALQAVIGIVLVFTLFSDKFIGSGMLVALGFGQGPGLALSIGNTWNEQLQGFGGTLGVSYAFLGFVFGGTVGVTLINIISRKNGMLKPRQYDEVSVAKQNIEIDTIREISILDGLTTQLVIISIIYGAVAATLFGSYYLLGLLPGEVGNQIFGLLKGFNFIIGIMYALVYKKIITRIERKGKSLRFMTNNYMLSNIASLSFNIMIAGSVMMITLTFLSEYGLQLIITSILAGVLTLLYLRYMTKIIYTHYKDEYFVGLFGMLTGVASTGIALLKGIDPNLESPVAEEMVLGSGTAISVALPLFVILFLPSFGYGTSNAGLLNWISLFGCILYIVVFSTILIIRGKRGVNV